MKCIGLLILFIKLAIIYCSANDYNPVSGSDTLSSSAIKQKSVEPCRACKQLADSFLKALEETTRHSFEGGDADWEIEKLGKYENSELRFIEIQEKLCSDLKSGIDQCYNLAEVYESDLENWFFGEKKDDDLFTYLCIKRLKICCPDNTYGKNCVPCPGGKENPCGGHGKCKNGGTRKEPAFCKCDSGYKGKLCEKCAKGYYQVDTTEFSCDKCDKACKDNCRGPGPYNCEICAEGFTFIQNKGCIDSDDMSSENISNASNNLNPELSDTESDDHHQEL